MATPWLKKILSLCVFLKCEASWDGGVTVTLSEEAGGGATVTFSEEVSWRGGTLREGCAACVRHCRRGCLHSLRRALSRLRVGWWRNGSESRHLFSCSQEMPGKMRPCGSGVSIPRFRWIPPPRESSHAASRSSVAAVSSGSVGREAPLTVTGTPMAAIVSSKYFRSRTVRGSSGYADDNCWVCCFS